MTICVFGPNARQKDLYDQAIVPIVNEVLTVQYLLMDKLAQEKLLPWRVNVRSPSVKVTFLELYNEDLSKAVQEDKQKKQLPLMEDGKGGVLVRELEEEIVTSAIEIFTLLERGSAKRRTAETLLNKQSSRSHSLFSITIHIKEATPEGEELIKCGKLNLVDLAGSENISRSGAREEIASSHVYCEIRWEEERRPVLLLQYHQLCIVLRKPIRNMSKG
ncbi:Kinesin-like protein KIN-5C [Castilleja foliolosa]|uniref:Kinesin-like protein KIN-5C n=1 Tax=Castilleja foliolosa TaxID=1961234 RepID=A0ABD3DPV6_9LAMI